MNTPTPENPCLECGQCCQRLRVSFYHAEPVPAALTVQLTPHRACMRGTEAGRGCVALAHTPEAGYRCTIYEERPSPCRDFNVVEESGEANLTCARLRAEAGLPTLPQHMQMQASP
jgi:Fe-S-cluster containining protein